MSHALCIIVALLVGFLFGNGMMLASWEGSAKRGGFEVGHVLYHVEVIKP